MATTVASGRFRCCDPYPCMRSISIPKDLDEIVDGEIAPRRVTFIGCSCIVLTREGLEVAWDWGSFAMIGLLLLLQELVGWLRERSRLRCAERLAREEMYGVEMYGVEMTVENRAATARTRKDRCKHLSVDHDDIRG
jgi:hypothetical protein